MQKEEGAGGGDAKRIYGAGELKEAIWRISFN